MKKAYALITAFLVIALISGGYALINNGGSNDAPAATVNDNSHPSSVPTASVSDIAPAAAGENPLIAVAEIIRANPVSNPVTDTAAKYVLSANGKDYVNSNQDFTDKYYQCCECGKFVSLGEVTKEIPEARKCTCSEELAGIGHLNADDYYVYTYEEVMYYISTGEFPDSVQERRNIYEENVKATIAEIISHYKAIPGYEDTFVNASQDFTDKYVKCCECGKYIPLGDITSSLPENMTCNHSTRGHSIAYLDTNIWGVMDYEKVVYAINNPENVTGYPEINEDMGKVLGIGSNMESSLIIRQNFDYIIYDYGLWDEGIQTNVEHEGIQTNVELFTGYITLHDYTAPETPVLEENQNSEDI